MRSRRWASLVVLLCGCASTPTALPDFGGGKKSVFIDTGMSGSDVLLIESWVEGDVTRTAVAAGADRSWDALLDVQSGLGLPVNLVDPGNRVTGVQEARVQRLADRRPAEYLDCGRGMNGAYANVYQVYVTIITRVLPSDGGGSELRTQFDATAKDPAHGNVAIRCTSNRKLEREIAAAVRAHVAGAVAEAAGGG